MDSGPVTKLTIAYDGTAFAGWARQPAKRSVQEELERAIERILGVELRLSVAGRTDRGVHAWRQVASYHHEALDPRGLNAVLPPEALVDAMFVSSATRRVPPVKDLGPLTDEYSITSDWDNQWLTSGLEKEVIEEAHLDPQTIFEGVKRFANDRAKRLERQSAVLARAQK